MPNLTKRVIDAAKPTKSEFFLGAHRRPALVCEFTRAVERYSLFSSASDLAKGPNAIRSVFMGHSLSIRRGSRPND